MAIVETWGTSERTRIGAQYVRELPSGKHLHGYGKSPFLMGKSTISMAIFNCLDMTQMLGDKPP